MNNKELTELYHEQFARIKQLEAENEALRDGIRGAMNNIGVPSAGYPSPMVEAYEILSALLTEESE